ncbi:MAG: hypothetical protein U1E15_12665 [Hyphomicrobiales bacterium]
MGEIPCVETVELTPETARKALDAYVMVKDKYKDADLEGFEKPAGLRGPGPQGKISRPTSNPSVSTM